MQILHVMSYMNDRAQARTSPSRSVENEHVRQTAVTNITRATSFLQDY